MKKTLFICLFALMAFSCNEPKQLKVTLVFDKPLEGYKYPVYVKDMVTPFFVNDCETIEEVLLKPINVIRSDIKRSGKEINAWYFESMGELSVDFSRDWLKYYFTDSLVDPYLIQKSKNRKLNLDNYLKEGKNSFIYHENSENEEYKNHQIFSDGVSLNKAIQNVACDETITEVYVLINPTKLTTFISKNKDSVIDTNKVSKRLAPCESQTVANALDLKQDMLEIIDTRKSYKERDLLAKKVWKKYFDNMASVKMYVKKDQQYPDFWESGDSKNYFVARLAFKNSIHDINISRIEYHKETNKISAITVYECHNASEIE